MGCRAGRGGLSLLPVLDIEESDRGCCRYPLPGTSVAVLTVGGAAGAGEAITMLMKPGLFSRPAMSKLPTPPVCG